jgi:hypothetical protein
VSQNKLAKVAREQAKGWALHNKLAARTRKKMKRFGSKAVRVALRQEDAGE